MPADGSGYVVRRFSMNTSPVASSSSTKSVNVPPISHPTRNDRELVTRVPARSGSLHRPRLPLHERGVHLLEELRVEHLLARQLLLQTADLDVQVTMLVGRLDAALVDDHRVLVQGHAADQHVLG